MSKYQVGDKVLVRDDLEVGENYSMENGKSFNSFVIDMNKLSGKVVTIESTDYQYRIEELNFGWTDEMFAGKVVKKDVYEVGDKVVLREDLVGGNSYGDLYFNESMSRQKGKALTLESNSPNGHFSIREASFYYSNEMFIGAVITDAIVEEDETFSESLNLDSYLNLHLERVIYSNPATILFYHTGDGITKKIVAKLNPLDTYNKEDGLRVAILKAYRKQIDKELRSI